LTSENTFVFFWVSADTHSIYPNQTLGNRQSHSRAILIGKREILVERAYDDLLNGIQ